MSSWHEVEEEQPDLAREVKARMDAHVHKVMATVRADGSPRLCGSEIVFHGGDLWLAGMTGARRFADLRRDPRVAVHSCPEDVPGWTGDARLSGTAHEVTDAATKKAIQDGAPPGSPTGPYELFRVDVTELVSVALDPGGESIVVTSWRPGREVTRTSRQ